MNYSSNKNSPLIFMGGQGGTLDCMARVSSLLEGKHLNTLQLWVAPASSEVYYLAGTMGYLSKLLRAGACVLSHAVQPECCLQSWGQAAILTNAGEMEAKALRATYLGTEALLALLCKDAVCTDGETTAEAVVWQEDALPEAWRSAYAQIAALPPDAGQQLLVIEQGNWSLQALEELEGLPISQACLGPGRGGSLEKLRLATEILRGHRIRRGFRLWVTPASRIVMEQALELGYLQELVAVGAWILPPENGVALRQLECSLTEQESGVGTVHLARGYGSGKTVIYLASPAVVAASAAAGRLAHPDKVQW